VKKNVPVYELTVKVWGKGKTRRDEEESVVVLKREFREWFDEKGFMHVLPLQQLIASNVGVVGEADPERVVDEKNLKKKLIQKVKTEQGDEGVGEVDMDSKWEALLKESQEETPAVSTAMAKSKAKKRGKKV